MRKWPWRKTGLGRFPGPPLAPRPRRVPVCSLKFSAPPFSFIYGGKKFFRPSPRMEGRGQSRGGGHYPPDARGDLHGPRNRVGGARNSYNFQGLSRRGMGDAFPECRRRGYADSGECPAVGRSAALRRRRPDHSLRQRRHLFHGRLHALDACPQPEWPVAARTGRRPFFQPIPPLLQH